MKLIAEFGFVTGCYGRDLPMVRATLASIRHYCPKAPICLIVDGDADVGVLADQYKLHLLRVAEMESARVRGMIQSSTRSKLAAIWEGPFERFVWLDSDAIVWGDFTDQVRDDVDFQIFWDQISIDADEESAPSWLAHYYFDTERLHAFDPAFNWRGKPYFCDGVFACRRGAIPVEIWEKALSWRDSSSNPWPPSFNCMPMMNYIVHAMADQGWISSAMTDLQQIPVHHGHEEIEVDLVGCDWRFPENVARPRTLHFCGRKPYTFSRDVFTKPFTIARLEHYRALKSSSGAWAAIAREDARVAFGKVRQRIYRRFRKT